jgi:predicted RNA-binding Zn ribbon-like protein
MDALWVGGHPAIDFLNTAYGPAGEPVETIGDGRAFLEWLVAAELLETADVNRLQRRLGAAGLDQAAREARRVREWAREWLERWRRRPGGRYTEEVTALNQALGGGAWRRQLVATADGLVVQERIRPDDAGALIAMLADRIAQLVAREDASLVKQCAGPGCTLWFLDRTKAHARRFCSAAACGNRAKVAAFRERQRT